MKLIIQGKQLKLSSNLKSYVDEHVMRPLSRFYDDEAAELRVELGVQSRRRGESRECHMTFHMPNAKTIQIEETAPDLYGSIDAAADRLLRTVKKEKSRMRQPPGRHKQHPLSSVAAEGGVPRGLIEHLPGGDPFRKLSSPRRKGPKASPARGATVAGPRARSAGKAASASLDE